MPSPIGHFLAGVTTSVAAESNSDAARPWPRLALLCGFLAAAPDLDLISPERHRTATHSLAAVALVFVVTALITRWRQGRVDWRTALACGAAYGTHLLADFLGADPSVSAGQELFWPWLPQHYMSGWEVFRATERDYPFSIYAITMNAKALAQELLVIGPVLLVLWRRRLARAAARSRD